MESRSRQPQGPLRGGRTGALSQEAMPRALRSGLVAELGTAGASRALGDEMVNCPRTKSGSAYTRARVSRGNARSAEVGQSESSPTVLPTVRRKRPLRQVEAAVGGG